DLLAVVPQALELVPDLAAVGEPVPQGLVVPAAATLAAAPGAVGRGDVVPLVGVILDVLGLARELSDQIIEQGRGLRGPPGAEGVGIRTLPDALVGDVRLQ